METLDANLSQLPSMLWARTLKKRTGWTYGKIQKEYSLSFQKENPDFSMQSSRCLYKYDKGVRVRGRKFVDMIEAGLPGTKRLLTHPLWEILGNPNATNQQLSEYIEALELSVKQKLFVYDKKDGVYKRRDLKKVREIYYISMKNNLDALACLLILVREFEIKEQVDPYIICKWEAYYLLARIGLFPPLKDLVASIYKYMYPLFIGKNDPLPLSFETFFSKHMPEHFRPPPNVDVNLLLEMNSSILEVMIRKKIISSNEDEQMKFLFFIENSGKKREILFMLEDFNPLSTDKKFPEPLNLVMSMMKGDSRHYLSGRSFLLGKKIYAEN